MHLRKFHSTCTVLGLAAFLVVASANGGQHTVVGGDTLSEIAWVHKIPTADLAAANQIANSDLIVPGQVLQIPGSSAPAPAPAPVTPGSHIVQPGETLSEVALRYNVSVEELRALNQLADANLIIAFQQLHVPSTPSPPAAPVAGPVAPPRPSSPELETIIDQISAADGVDPKLMRALAWVESTWDQGAVSSSGAVGVMQVLPSTAAWLEKESFGYELNEDMSVYDNVRAGVRLFRVMLDLTGDPELALAAYYQGYSPTAAGKIYEETHRYTSYVHTIKDRFWP